MTSEKYGKLKCLEVVKVLCKCQVFIIYKIGLGGKSVLEHLPRPWVLPKALQTIICSQNKVLLKVSFGQRSEKE
jgi:hypothetical protein